MTGRGMDIEELRKDAKEAKTLLETATRQRLKDVLSLELMKIETKIKTLEQTETKSEKPSTPSNTATSTTRAYTTIIRNYSWDQSDKFLKFYVTLKGVHDLNTENIVCNFEAVSLFFKVSELEGKNHELNISKMAYTIIPDKSYFKVKTDMVVIFAAKEFQGVNWEAITFEEKRILDAKKKTDLGSNKEDPSSGLMGMMKQMYDDGDDEMKRMLNKTWYESQQKTKGGLESDLAGMNMNMDI